MSSFEELLGETLAVVASAERAAAVGAYLRMLDGEEVDPSVRPALAAVGRVALPGAEDLPAEQRQVLTGAVLAFLRQAADLLEDPGRSPGWTYSDPLILQAQGRLSMTLAPVLGAAIRDLGDLDARLENGGTFCDVGTGVGWLAIGAAGVWPQARIVGIDIHRPALDIAATNVTSSGLEDQIELRLQDVRNLPTAAFDLIWLPGPFLPSDIISAALSSARAGLRSGGWVVFGLYGGPEDPESMTMAELRTLRTGGWPANAEQVIARLTAAGFVNNHQVARAWKVPVRLVVGMSP